MKDPKQAAVVGTLQDAALRMSRKVFIALLLAAAGMGLGCNSGTTAQEAAAKPPALVPAMPSGTAWSFAVMADSQWLGADDGENPDSVSVGIINQMNAEFIKQKVKFVVQVGDLTSSGTQTCLNVRATYAQGLYNAGIGYFPLRGNHEPTATDAAAFVHAFPQTQNGMNNATPSDAFVTTDDDEETQPQARTGSSFQLGTSFSSPNASLQGLTYSFDFNNARFVLLDQYTPFDRKSNSIASQQGWLNNTLSTRAVGSHAFVFSHQGLICPYQPDSLFGTYPAASFESMFVAQDAFISGLHDNGVRYHIFGHDHFHERSVSTTSSGNGKKVTEVFSAPSANWLFMPRASQQWYDPAQFPNFQRSVNSQDVNHIGYYVYTVDGPNVTVDYYGAEVPSVFDESANWGSGRFEVDHTPALTFTKRETFGYGQAGKEFLVPQSDAYSSVVDSFNGITGRILGGTNGDPAQDYYGQSMTKAVNTGWRVGPTGLFSPVLTLWGLAPLGTAGSTEPFVLSVQYDLYAVSKEVLDHGWFGLASPCNGVWANAIDQNVGGTKRFVRGPWDPVYLLGTYGVDPATRTAWAIVNHEGDFAVAPLN